jgi:hypothetical protein
MNGRGGGRAEIDECRERGKYEKLFSGVRVVARGLGLGWSLRGMLPHPIRSSHFSFNIFLENNISTSL